MPALSFVLSGGLGGGAGGGASTAAPRVRNLWVDPETGALSLDGRGNLRVVADLESVAQGMRVALGLYRGEWFLDETIGTDWLGTILVKNPDPVATAQELRRVIGGVAGVRTIDALDAVLDKRTRNLRGTVRATADLARLASTFVQPVTVGV